MLALGKGRREVQGTEGHPILCLMLALVTYDTVSRVGGKQFIQCLHRIDRIFQNGSVCPWSCINEFQSYSKLSMYSTTELQCHLPLIHPL